MTPALLAGFNVPSLTSRPPPLTWRFCYPHDRLQPCVPQQVMLPLAYPNCRCVGCRAILAAVSPIHVLMCINKPLCPPANGTMPTPQILQNAGTGRLEDPGICSHIWHAASFRCSYSSPHEQLSYRSMLPGDSPVHFQLSVAWGRVTEQADRSDRQKKFGGYAGHGANYFRQPG